jgi:hypothetical protein
MRPQTLKTLRASDYYWYGDNNSHNGKSHILDEISFDDDYHPFYVKAICGTSFKTRYKDSASNLDSKIGVGCFNCMVKAGYVKYDSPYCIELTGQKEQVGKVYEVLVPFECWRFSSEKRTYKAGDKYIYHYSSK